MRLKRGLIFVRQTGSPHLSPSQPAGQPPPASHSKGNTALKHNMGVDYEVRPSKIFSN